MSDELSSSDRALPQHKIFPRNLTARADYIVAGNPANSRPEAGVDNCFPGLEFDQRNLDQRFFPGVVLYFHRGDGARVIEAPLTDDQRKAGIDFGDILSRPFYVWGMLGRFLVENPDPSMVGFQSQQGMEVWRRVHDLLPGPVAVAFGPGPGLGSNLSDDMQTALKAAYSALDGSGDKAARYVTMKDKDGNVICIVIAEQRARYLDENGVIEPVAYPPGDITKTMCAPWMYDFRDCYCFYWSSNKPDIVNVPVKETVRPYVNFLRRVEDRVEEPPFDVDFYWRMDGAKKIQRREFELTYENTVEGWWQKLPVVLDDTESATSIASRDPEPSAVAAQMDLSDVIRELSYLATVEHALTVEYLYAYYSLNTPAPAQGDQPPPSDQSTKIRAAAAQVFAIAVDEMRHLLWANLALYYLGAPASVGRAERIGEPPDPARNDRKELKGASISYLDMPFALHPLDARTLDWFIEVEAPSKAINHGLDGMYVYILERLRLAGGEIPHAGSLIPLIKLIIDEGHGHWERFSRIKQTLNGIPESEYLRKLDPRPPSPTDASYLDACDAYYHLILKTIEVSVTLGRQSQAQLIGAAIRVMQNLDELALVLGARGYLPRFALPARPHVLAKTTTAKFALAAAETPKLADLETIYGKIDEALADVSRDGTPEDRRHANEQRRRLTGHISDVDRILARHQTS
jgi:Ferritin-like